VIVYHRRKGGETFIGHLLTRDSPCDVDGTDRVSPTMQGDAMKARTQRA
jgi:hypothetical protein